MFCIYPNIPNANSIPSIDTIRPYLQLGNWLTKILLVLTCSAICKMVGIVENLSAIGSMPVHIKTVSTISVDNLVGCGRI
jgi:hypothetical protein